ncbi:PREDICTED: uncharacterized protein LOC108568989 [Nicrophorus vespilloides]|uniref:Uncharacterized protein LOC108568989 n=1 Tax=Nicrophorus vespilloides TaxID=110193 RepID=A0ABM1NG87_NICVS|nr:PREDICTED: uncharacterized protein LOC108568989 [Nicrophorus vespilloides]XP_017785836.1 PREDICTED: uncharacterized protein LOC108568989 [Nicrophorus vespilloides]XP_017785837.1 PREDICTED: uncharacterized protein LOC108568989 [Nicrophorus vespilloides]XP_017785838.1 PREDICTED: uncharacterized protein LOC108568989 [Nicrophorus vespilloides]
MLNEVKDFHKLGGSTLGEHQWNFRKFMDRISGLPNRVEITMSIRPRNHQEAIFKVKLLQRFRQQWVLLNILLEGNKVLNRIILNNREFIHYAGEIEVYTFVNVVCPKLSHVSKLILFNKLGSTLLNGDTHFNLIFEKYGIRLAFKLLPSCSEELVMEISENYSFRFNSRQLIVLHRKYPNFLMNYFQSGYANLVVRKKLTDYLVKNDMETLRDLVEFGLPTLGRKGMLKFLDINKEYVLENPGKFQRHYDRIVRSLNHDEFDIYFKNLFPKRIDDNPDFFDAIRNLSLLPPRIRYRKFNGVYAELYGLDFCEFDKNLVELFTWRDRSKFELGDNLELYLIKDALRLIEATMKVTHDTESRCNLVRMMIETCRINKKLDRLLDVLNYFCDVHKNDSVEVRRTIISQLLCNFNLKKFCDESWYCIEEMFHTFKKRNEMCFDKGDFTKALIMKKISLNEDYRNDLLEFMDDIVRYNYLNILDRNQPKQHRIFLLKFAMNIEYFGDLTSRDSSVYFIDLLCEFNKNNPKYKISYYRFPSMVRDVFEEFYKEEYDCKSKIDTILRFIPTEPIEIDLRDELLQKFMESDKSEISLQLAMWMLKYRQCMLKKYIKKFIWKGASFSRLYYEISKMRYTKLPKLYRSTCTENLRSMRKTNGLWYLSYEADYLKLVERFIPEGFNENVMEFQKNLLKTFKNRYMEWPHLSIILNYLNGDYSKYAVGSMYRSFYNLPEYELVHHLKVISEISDSLKKHSIYLSSELLDYRYIKLILMETASTDNIKCAMFVSTFYSFCNNPKTNLLILLKQQMDIMQEHRIIFKFKIIPKHVLIDYLTEFRDYLRCGSEDDLTAFNILKPDLISQLPADFCEEILALVLFSKDCYQFVYNYIVSSHEDSVGKLHEAIENSQVENKLFLVTDLYDYIFRKFIRERSRDLAQSRSADFMPYLEQRFGNNLEIDLMVKSVCSYLESGFDGLARCYVVQQGEIVQEFGPSIIIYHSKVANKCLHRILDNVDGDRDENTCVFIDTLLNESNLTHIKLLAIELLPLLKSKNQRLILFMLQLLEKIEEDPSETIQTFLYYKHACKDL